MMAKENQAVTADLTRLGAEKEDGRRALGDALHKAATAEQVCPCSMQFYYRAGRGLVRNR